MFEFNRGREQAGPLRVISVSPFAPTSETRGIVTPYDECAVIFDSYSSFAVTPLLLSLVADSRKPR